MWPERDPVIAPLTAKEAVAKGNDMIKGPAGPPI